MKFKLDENLDPAFVELFRQRGHDCLSVHDQGMAGWLDEELVPALSREGRCLVTLDKDFSNPFQFPPENNAGLVVLRAPTSTFATFEHLILEALSRVNEKSPIGELWIVEPGRIRVHSAD